MPATRRRCSSTSSSGSPTPSMTTRANLAASSVGSTPLRLVDNLEHLPGVDLVRLGLIRDVLEAL